MEMTEVIILNKKFTTAKNLLFVSFMVFIVIPTLASGVIYYLYATDMIEKKITMHMLDVVDHQNLIVEKKAESIENFLLNLSASEEVQSLLYNGKVSNYDSALQKQFLAIDKMIDSSKWQELPIDNVLLTHLNQSYYFYRRKVFFDEKKLLDSTWYTAALSSTKETHWAGLELDQSIFNLSHTFNVSKAILSKENYQVSGVAFIAFNSEIMGPFFKDTGDRAYLSIVDRSGKILLSSNQALWNSTFPLKPLQKDVQYVKQTINDVKYLVIRSSPNKFGWVVVQQIPLDSLTNEIKKVRNFAIVIVMICLTVFAAFLIIIYRKISLPLQHMVSFVNDIQMNYKKLNIKNHPIYELLKIESGFLSLIEKNKHTNEELQETQTQRKEMEISKLQAKINPHFLYNTLNSIKYTALQNDQTKISDMLDSLVIFLRSSINKEGVFISLQQELENLKHYIFIQNSIYSNQIEFIFQTDDHLNQISIPNFILQPMVWSLHLG
jgi:two-component system sensor histidine kinase YesM